MVYHFPYGLDRILSTSPWSIQGVSLSLCTRHFPHRPDVVYHLLHGAESTISPSTWSRTGLNYIPYNPERTYHLPHYYGPVRPHSLQPTFVIQPHTCPHHLKTVTSHKGRSPTRMKGLAPRLTDGIFQ